MSGKAGVSTGVAVGGESNEKKYAARSCAAGRNVQFPYDPEKIFVNHPNPAPPGPTQEVNP